MSKFTKPISQQVADVITRAAESGTKETFAQELAALGSLEKLDRKRKSPSIKGALKGLLEKITTDPKKAANCLEIVREYVKNFGTGCLSYKAAAVEHKRVLNSVEKTKLENQLVRLNSYNPDVGVSVKSGAGREGLSSLPESKLPEQLAASQDRVAAQTRDEKDPVVNIVRDISKIIECGNTVSSKYFTRKFQSANMEAIAADQRISALLTRAVREGSSFEGEDGREVSKDSKNAGVNDPFKRYDVVESYFKACGADANYQAALEEVQRQYDVAATKDAEKGPRVFRNRHAFMARVREESVSLGDEVLTRYNAEVDKSNKEEELKLDIFIAKTKLSTAQTVAEIEQMKAEEAAASNAPIAPVDQYDGPNDGFEPSDGEDLEPVSKPLPAKEEDKKSVISEGAKESELFKQDLAKKALERKRAFEEGLKNQKREWEREWEQREREKRDAAHNDNVEDNETKGLPQQAGATRPKQYLTEKMVAKFNRYMQEGNELKAKRTIDKIISACNEDLAAKQVVSLDSRLGKMLELAVEKGYAGIVQNYQKAFGEDENYQKAEAAMKAKNMAQKEKAKQEYVWKLAEKLVRSMENNCEWDEAEALITTIISIYDGAGNKKQVPLPDYKLADMLKVALKQGYPGIVQNYQKAFGEDENYQKAAAADKAANSRETDLAAARKAVDLTARATLPGRVEGLPSIRIEAPLKARAGVPSPGFAVGVIGRRGSLDSGTGISSPEGSEDGSEGGVAVDSGAKNSTSRRASFVPSSPNTSTARLKTSRGPDRPGNGEVSRDSDLRRPTAESLSNKPRTI